MNKPRVGDIVAATDGAWSRVLNGVHAGKRVKRYHKNAKEIRYQVVATDCAIPVSGTATANTLIMSVDHEVFVAINGCNLGPFVLDIDLRFVAAGEDITNKLSDHSKCAVLRAGLHLHGSDY